MMGLLSIFAAIAANEGQHFSIDKTLAESTKGGWNLLNINSALRLDLEVTHANTFTFVVGTSETDSPPRPELTDNPLVAIHKSRLGRTAGDRQPHEPPSERHGNYSRTYPITRRTSLAG